MLPLGHKKYTYEEFLEITKDIERAEFIDGEIYCQASPNTEHQRISIKLSNKIFNYFDGKECEVFSAPYNIIFENSETGEKSSSQPDIVVICDKSKFTKTNYSGKPTLIIEILSDSTASIDTIKKMDLYMRFGVKEYWIVRPKSKTIDIYFLENGIYTEPMAYSKDDIVSSNIFSDLSIKLKDIFE